MSNRLAVFCAVLLAVALLWGCGTSTSIHVVHTPIGVEAATNVLPFETARIPEGAKAALPPATTMAVAAALRKHISVNGLHLIETFEGFSSCPYWDPYGRVATRGYGETEGISMHSACISRAFGEANLKSRIERFYEWALRSLGVNLNQNQWDALCSFIWNLGAGIFTGTLRYDLQHQYFQAAGQVMLQYVHAGGVVLAGLVTRRRAEVALFLKPVAQTARTLPQALAYRGQLRQLIGIHHCHQPPWHAAKPVFYERRCHLWLAHGAAVNHEIRAKGGK